MYAYNAHTVYIADQRPNKLFQCKPLVVLHAQVEPTDLLTVTFFPILTA